MDAIIPFIKNIADFIWGGQWNDNTILPVGPLAVVLLGTGLFMMIRLGARPVRRFIPALAEVWAGRKAQGKDGAITPWQALSTALSGQVGTGNLAGVATAITLGGPGAIFWMWISAIFGMALAFSESALAVKYRQMDAEGNVKGGPMYYIRDGLGKKWSWLAILFCIGTIFSASATGTMIQSNSIAEAATELGNSMGVSIEPRMVGIVISALIFAVIVGGIKSIGAVAGKVVPFMAGLYVLIAAGVLIANAPLVPGAFMEIISYAFGWEQATGGVAGFAVMMAVRAGIARGLFSNEAGQGSAPIAHAAAKTDSPTRQGEIAMIGVFIDTLVICTMTALVILTVQGNFKVNPAWQAASSCMRAGVIEMPSIQSANSEAAKTLPFEDVFPTTTDSDRLENTLKHGATAQLLLQSCASVLPGIVSEAALTAAYPGAVAAYDASPVLAAFDNPEGAESEAIITRAQSQLLPIIEASYIIERHAWKTDAVSSGVTTRAYEAAIPIIGGFIVPVAIFLFAFTTIIGWSYYGETAAIYLFGDWVRLPIRYFWVIVVFAGTLWTDIGALWLLGDISNASMAFPNLIAIIALSSVVVSLHKQSGKQADDAQQADV